MLLDARDERLVFMCRSMVLTHVGEVPRDILVFSKRSPSTMLNHGRRTEEKN